VNEVTDSAVLAQAMTPVTADVTASRRDRRDKALPSWWSSTPPTTTS
jgi:hypothetical protein